MFCPKCGKQLPEGAKFCGGCGSPIQIKPVQTMHGQGGFVSLAKRPPNMTAPRNTAVPPNMTAPRNTAVPPNMTAQQNTAVPPNMTAQQNTAVPPNMTARQNTAATSDMTVPLNMAVSPNMTAPQSMAVPPDVRDAERRNRKLTVILSIVLFVLVLAAVGIGVYYFKVVKGELDNPAPDQMVESDKEAETETEGNAEELVEQDQTAAAEDVEEKTGAVSDTNEVVADTILENIPKSVYSYQFNGDLGGAQLVTRSDIDVEPEASEEREPQYVHGIDGQAVYLDGTYGIKLSDVENVGDSYTIAFWMKADQLCDWSPFIHIGYDLEDPEKRVRLWLGQKTDGVSVAPIISSERAEVKDSFEIRPAQSMPNSVEPGIWYHIAFTVDASRQGSRAGSVLGTLYVAGQYIGSGDIVVNTLNTDKSDVYLGINRWDQLYPAAFDEVKIWNQVLEAQQVRELYDAYE